MPSPSLYPFHHLIGWSHPCPLFSMTTNKHINHIVYPPILGSLMRFWSTDKTLYWAFGTISQRYSEAQQNLKFTSSPFITFYLSLFSVIQNGNIIFKKRSCINPHIYHFLLQKVCLNEFQILFRIIALIFMYIL